MLGVAGRRVGHQGFPSTPSRCPNPRDPSTFSEGDRRNCYVGLEVQVPSEVRYDWIPRVRVEEGPCQLGVLPRLKPAFTSWARGGGEDAPPLYPM